MKQKVEEQDLSAVAIEFDEPGAIDQEGLAVEDVYGSRGKKGSSEAARNGVAPSTEEGVRYYFYPTWRSQFLNLCAFGILSVLGIVLSHYVPALVIRGSLFKLGSTNYCLDLPILVLFPGAMLGKVLINMYNSKYIIDERGVEAQIGLVAMLLRQPRLRWEDIRGVEPVQSLWERILGIGSVLIGSAMTQDVEITMSGVANPRAIQLLIQAERDRRLEKWTKAGLAPTARAAAGILSD